MNASEADLRRALQSLAQPAEVQTCLFPDFAAEADALDLEFDQALQNTRPAQGARWSVLQAKAIEPLERAIDATSGPGRPERWESPDCLLPPTWSEFRSPATPARSAFGGPVEPPPPSGAVSAGPPGA